MKKEQQMPNFKIIYTDFFDESEQIEFYTEAADASEAFHAWYDYFNRGRSYHSRFVSLQEI
jgi:hypothetical protein